MDSVPKGLRVAGLSLRQGCAVSGTHRDARLCVGCWGQVEAGMAKREEGCFLPGGVPTGRGGGQGLT